MERFESRVGPDAVALETTLLCHGVPRADALPLHRALCALVRRAGAEPALVGVVDGRAIVGLDDDELERLLDAPSVPKLNVANLGLALARGSHGATTVSATMELAAAAGVQLFATGGLGGVHKGYGTALDVSADLAALARFPVAVVASGVKSILDVVATREALEALGVPVVGFRTDRFPAFYERESAAGVDGRFDSITELAAYVRLELARTGRGVLVVNPIPEADAVSSTNFATWLRAAEAEASDAGGRDRTPAVLAALHRVSGGATLRANLALVKANAHLAGQLRGAMSRLDHAELSRDE